MPANFAISVTIKALDQVTQTINRVTANVSKQSNSIKQFNTVMEKMSGGRSLTNSWSDLNAEVSGVFKSMETRRFFADVQSGAKSAVGSVKLLGDSLKQTVGVLTGAGLALGGLGFASNKLFSDISSSNFDLKYTASKLNVQPALLRAYRLSTESVGVPSSHVDAAFQRLNQMAFELRAGNPSAAEPLAALPGGVKLLDDQKRQRSPLDLLGEIADKLNTKGISQATRVELTSRIFGGAELLPYLSLGSTKIKQLTEKYHQPIPFEESSGAQARFSEASTQLKETLDRLKISFGIEVMPGVAKGLEKISLWVNDHGKELKQLFSDLGEAIPREMGSALSFMSLFAQALTLISKHVGVANLIFTAFAISIGSKLFQALILVLPSFQTLGLMGSGIVKVWSGVRAAILFVGSVLASPITWTTLAIGILIVALGSLAYVAYKNWDKIKAGFVKFKQDLMGAISEMISGISDALQKGYQAITDFFSFKSKSTSQIQVDSSLWLKNSTGKNDGLEKLLQSKTQKESKATSEVTVKFENLPKGAKISETKGDAKINIFAGYSLVGEGA